MRIEISVRFRDAEQDVAVTASADTRLESVLPELAAAVGAPPDITAWLDDRPLDPLLPLSGSPLRVGSVVQFGRAPHRAPRPGVLSVHVSGGPSAGAIAPLARGQLMIGRGADCDLQLADPDVSRQHAVLDVTPRSISLRDLGSTNGTRLNDRLVGSAGCAVQVADIICLGNSTLTLSGPIDSPASVQPMAGGCSLLLRPPRQFHVAQQREITVPVKPSSQRPRRVQWLSALLPAGAGAALAWFVGSPQFLLFALLSPLMLLSASLGDRVHWRRSRRREAATFQERLAAARQEIAEGLAAETAARRAAAPDAPTLLRQTRLPGGRIWERRRTDSDLLRVRIGTADLPATLSARTSSAAASAGLLRSVPLCVDLTDGPLGVAGPPDVADGLVRSLVSQVAALQSPGDVQFALLLSPERSEAWQFARWLPHLGGRVAGSAAEWPTLVADVLALVERRSAEHRGNAWTGPWLLLVIDRAARLADLSGVATILARGHAVGVTVLAVDTTEAALPTSCATVVRLHGETGTRVVLRQAGAAEQSSGVVDAVTLGWAAEVARNLAALVDGESSGTAPVPTGCTLFDVLGTVAEPKVIECRWAASRGGAATPIGSGPDGCYQLDLVRDGPHALVAGTTGAGKSELLRTLVVGLAAGHPPDQLSFVLIDYKGGAAFAECAHLPHANGVVTDLDPYMTERALRSLNSELRRRERLLAAAGAKDFAEYRETDNPEDLNRLVIVVDEFASLAQELPEFVRGLVSVAQRGRSLGVHLVLATQRPGSAVSADIRANTSLRIALRVTDPSESTDIIESPVAAAIPGNRPGRAYVRTADELTCIQSAHASAPAHESAEVCVARLGAWRREPPQPAGDTRSELRQLVDAVREAAARAGRRAGPGPWLPPLPASLPRAALPRPVCEAEIAFAAVDLPDQQRTETMTFTAGSSLLICGTARSGRTATLVSLALGAATQLPPEHLHLYVVDPVGALSAALRGLPHCRTVIGPDDLDLAAPLLSRLESLAARRGGIARGGDEVAKALVLIDGWDVVQAAVPDVDALACQDAVTAILRLGISAGVGLAVTGDRALLAPRFSAAFEHRILLRLADRADYGAAGIRPGDVPADLCAGRGVRASDGALLQVAHAGLDIDEVRASIAAAAHRWPAGPQLPDPDAIRMLPLPATVTLADLSGVDGRLMLGLAGEERSPVGIDPFSGPRRLLIAGPPRSGRSSVLQLLAQQASAAGIRTLVAATGRSPLRGAAESLAVPVLDPTSERLEDVPETPTLVLVDDVECYTDTVAGDRLACWARAVDAPLAMVVSGRADELATSYRGLAAEVRRHHCGILLRPGPVDGELLGVRLPRRPVGGPPGRGVAVGEPSWGPLFASGEPVPIQMATP